ncbi:MAG: pitrilysin family protein [Elusimicrobiota bacterium]
MIEYEKVVLDNGLTLLLAPDSTVPVVTLALTVPVGARQEQRGRSGFAHLFEHLMFQGSANVPKGRFDKILESCGAENNAWTDLDYTLYYETLPANALPVGLWLDADRLSALQITASALRNQIDVVKEEKRQNVYNEAYGRLLWVDIAARAFANWQNAHDTYGGFADLESASLSDVRRFFADQYAPRNTKIAIVGDFDPAEARRQARRYFAWIPNRGEPAAVDATEPRQTKERRFLAEDAHAAVAGTAIVWNNMPARRSPDYYAMSLLGRLMFLGKSARLYQLLVKDAKAASAVDEPYTGGLGFPVAGWSTYRQPGLFGGFILRKDGVSTAAIRRHVYGAVERIAKKGVGKEELARAKTKLRSDWIRSRQTTHGRAEALLVASVLDGDAGAANGELERFLAVTGEDLRAAAAKYLIASAANVFDLKPSKQSPPPESSKPRASKKDAAGHAGVKRAPAAPRRPDMSHRPAVRSMKPYRAPRRERFRLANGLRVVYVRDQRYPLVSVRLAVPGGIALTSLESPGLVRAMAELMTEGTQAKSARAVAEAADAFGGTIGARAGRDYVVVRASSLSDKTDDMLRLFSAVALRPTFPQAEVALRRKNMLEELKLQRSQPQFLASIAFNRRLFGGHSYSVVAPTEASITRINRRRLRALHRRIFDPGRAHLVVVGDIPRRELRDMLERSLGRWRPAAGAPPLPSAGDLEPEDTPPTSVTFFDRPGSEQSAVIIGGIVPREDYAGYDALLLANQILGGSFAARLSTDLREKRGYTYGIYSYLETSRHAGIFSVGTQVRPSVTGATITGVLDHMRRLRAEPVKRAELQQAKNMLIGDFARDLETQAGMADAVLYGLLRGLPENYLDTYVDEVQAVSVGGVQRAAKKYLRPDRLVISVVGDGAALSGALDAYGPVLKVDNEGRAR